MKKYLKTQAKRSLSLMLTFVMLMSCFVCAAPAIAEALDKEVAGTQSAPSYKVEIIYDIPNAAACANNAPEDSKLTVTYAPDLNDLTKTTTAELNTGKLGDADDKTNQSQALTVTGFPTAVTFWVNGGGGLAACEVAVHEIRINGVSVIDYANAPKTRYTFGNGDDQTATWTPDYDTDSTGSTGIVNGTGGYTGWKWKKPSASFDTTNFKDIELTMPKITGSENKAYVTSSTFSTTVKDTVYNTSWSSAPTYFLSTSSSAAQATDFGDAFGLTTSGSGAYITLTEELQTSYGPNATDAQGRAYRDFYLRAFVTSSVNTGSTVRVYYPKYDWHFDATVQGSGDSKADIIMQDGSIWDNGNGIIDAKEYLAYGQKAGIYPLDAKKEGFTFYGFWTKKQPATIGAKGDPFALEAEFEAPISSNEYSALTPELQEKYADAGEKWDPKADSSQLVTEGDKKYYGWWLSNDISVKFYDVNGKFLGEKNVKHGQTNGAFTWPTPTESYSNGALSYSNWTGKWENIDGVEVDSKNHTFTKDLILTPVYDTVTSDYKYNVIFNKTFGTFGSPYSGEYTYREKANVPTEDIGTIVADDAYTYEFEGWAVSAPASGNYHIIEEDGDFDAAGNAVNLVSDFTVRSDVSYYPVFRRFIRSYDVTFSYKDSTGADKTDTKTFKYGERITAPDGVPTEYATGGYGFTFLGWTKGGADVNMGAETCVPGLTYTAKYSEGVATPYTVTFEYRNEKGDLVTKEVQVNHGQKITQDTVNSLAPATTYDNGEALVTYNGVWEYNGKRYDTADLTSFSPESHVTFTAVYENPQPFYTVTYVDGDITKAYRVVEGTVLPFWTYETTEEGATVEVEYKPTRANTEDGAYEFTGWFDAQEGGNEYIPGETEVTGNVTLYPQFSYDRFTYNIVFMNYDGTKELAKGTFYYGDELKDTINAAENSAKGANIKPADDTYSYQFLGWDKRVPEFCEGGEPGSTTVFTAQYKPVYIYYNIEWYNDAEATTSLYTSKYIYGDKIYTPAVELTLPTPGAEDAGREYVFAGWFYKVGDTEYQYERGMNLTKDIMTDSVVKMYAKYELTDKTYTVTVNDGSKPYTLTVKEGDTIAALISDPADGYVDETYHREFTGWVTGEEETAFDVNAPITADITITAQFEQNEHNLTMQEVTKVPTYPMAAYTDHDGTVVEATDGTGRYAKWCECDKDKTYTEAEEYTIDALTDEVAPSGTVYIGDKWQGSSAEGDEVLYLNGKTNFIITTTDKGDVNADYNQAGLGIGVQKIEVKVEGLTGDAYVEVYNWTDIQSQLIAYYEGWNNVPSMYQNYNANVTLNANDYNFVEGVTYTVYVKITDKANNVGEISTISFVYDSTAPVVELDGDSNIAGDVFCEEVTVKVTEANDYTITANGTDLEPALDENDAVIEDAYVIDAAGKYQIVVTDGAGNKTTKFIEVLKEHNGQEVRVEPTCIVAGSESVKCLNCGKLLGEETEIPATGHTTTTEFIDATCTEDGYDLITCSACDLEERVYWEADENGRPLETDEDGNPVYKAPKLGHTYDTNLDNKVDEGAKGEVTKAATCVKTGTMKYTCERCDAYTTTEIAIDEDAHNFYNPVTKKPTCTEAGQVSETCKLCRETVITAQGTDEEAENYDAAYKAKGHTESTDYKIIKRATCAEDGSQTKYCTVCNVNIGAAVTIKKETVAHTWEYTSTTAPSTDAEGYTLYTCEVCGATQMRDYVDKLTACTVKFFNEDGTVIATIDEYEGNTIAANAVAEPTKANSEDGKTKYTFAGWYTKKEDGSYDKKYNLPLTVSGDLELYAKFNESDIIYTVQFEVPTTYENGAFGDYEVTKELMGAKGDKREPAADPVFKADTYNTYEFKGWARAGELVAGDITISDNATYQAVFTVVPKKVGVIFMNGSQAIYKAEVNVGGNAAYDAEKYGTPEKDFDATNHYKFSNKWYEDAACTKQATLTNITSSITVYAGFTATPHDWEVVEETEATCTLPAITDSECKDCDAEKSEETAKALGHNPGEPVFDEETGKNITRCTVCDEVLSEDEASYKIIFKNDNGTELDRINVAYNGEVVYSGNTPTKAETVQYTYTFAGWKDADGKEYAVGTALPAATANVTYTAYFTQVTRTFRVTYVDSKNNTLYTTTGVEYGAEIPEYRGTTATSALEGPKWDNDGHYVFDKWNVADDTTVTADMVIKPTFKKVAHKIKDVQGEATCTKPGGITKICEDGCGYEYNDGSVPVIPHKWVLDTNKSYGPDLDLMKPGLNVYYCEYGCGNTKEEVVPVSARIINVTVKDQSGKTVEGAKVDLYKDGEWIDVKYSNAEGKVTFQVRDEGTYTVLVSGVKDAENVQYDITVGENGYDDNGNGPTLNITDCTCACHRDGFWGSIFRFFHKIIKFFTGKFNCCACPDERY